MSTRLADLMRQGFMKPRKSHKPTPAPPTVACELCQNWHRDGSHTHLKLQPGARVYVLARLFGGLEEQYGVIVTGKTRDERPYGVGDVRPHVRVAFDGDSTPRWVCVEELRQR